MESQVKVDGLKEKDFGGASEARKRHWDHCVCSQEDYFKGNGDKIYKRQACTILDHY